MPQLFKDIEDIGKVKLEDINLHHLILHHLWDQYRYDKKNYTWSDIRIRAQGEGVALSAHAGAIEGISIGGIRGLANAIRRAIERELNDRYKKILPEPDNFDEVILKTLIQEFGALSYEFRLETLTGSKLFRAHSYFGMKPNFSSDDKFSHLRVYNSWRSDLEQLLFLLDHLEASENEAHSPKQHKLF